MKSTSKNQRRAPVTGAYTEVGDIARFVVLGDNHCYIFDPRNGKTHRLRVGTPEFWQLLADIEPQAGLQRMAGEARRHAANHPGSTWPQVADRLEAQIAGQLEAQAA